MAKKTRTELIEECQKSGWITEKELDFYRLSHEEKANPKVFENFCKEHGGYLGILLSDEKICDDKQLVLMAYHYGWFSNYHLL